MIRQILLLVLFILSAPQAQALPANSHANVFGGGWACDKGFKRTGNRCTKVKIPKNARLSILGDRWECNTGFKQTGNGCSKVQIPKNARISILGDRWECNKGFKRTGNGCTKVQIPKNARLSILGDRWECYKGFKRTGNGCSKVQIPKNARISILGDRWECNKTFKKANNACVRMTPQEIKKQRQIEKVVLAEMARRRAQGISGSDCEIEYKTNANVCVEVSRSNLDCNENYDGDYYNDCDVNLSYDIETDYSGGAYLDVEVDCRVEIEYTGREIYSTRSDSSSQDESHSLYAHGSDRESKNFNFSFSSYDEVTSAKLMSVDCKVDSVNLY